MIYFDHGATSFPKPKEVLREMERCMEVYCGNPGRSGHKMSMQMGEKIYETRKNLAKLLGISDPSRLLFTKNTTESLNLALFGLLKEGDHVVTSSMEHNSMLRPLVALEQKGIPHTIVKCDEKGRIVIEDIENAICENTKLIAVTGASNVTGTIFPLKEIGDLAKQKGIKLLVDGAQVTGMRPIPVEEYGISLYAFPGHKGLLGPQGTGGLYVSPKIELQPLLFGGTGTISKTTRQPREFPEGFETGTVNGPGIIGLGEGVKILQRIGLDTIAFYETQLISYLETFLKNMERVKLYGPPSNEKVGICLFNIIGKSSEEITARLSLEYDIAVRGGYHCAGLAHETIGTEEGGAVRLSVGPFNTRREIRYAAEAIWKLSQEQ